MVVSCSFSFHVFPSLQTAGSGPRSPKRAFHSHDENQLDIKARVARFGHEMEVLLGFVGYSWMKFYKIGIPNIALAEPTGWQWREREREYLIYYIYIHINSQQSLAALQCNSVKSIEIHRNPSNHHLYLNAIPATLRKSVAAHGKDQPLNRMGITYRSLPQKKKHHRIVISSQFDGSSLVILYGGGPFSVLAAMACRTAAAFQQNALRRIAVLLPMAAWLDLLG